MKEIFIQLEKKKQELDKKRPFPVESIQSLREKIHLDWICHSNAIEGNTLTLSETKIVLEGYPLKKP